METDASYLPDPPRRSLIARVIALIALFGAIVVVIVVVTGSLSVDNSASGTGATTTQQVPKNHGEIPKKYTVEAGDSISSIAAKYQISVKRIERLNPGIDPQTLATGQVLKLH